jgi:hypothetical protein
MIWLLSIVMTTTSLWMLSISYSWKIDLLVKEKNMKIKTLFMVGLALLLCTGAFAQKKPKMPSSFQGIKLGVPITESVKACEDDKERKEKEFPFTAVMIFKGSYNDLCLYAGVWVVHGGFQTDFTPNNSLAPQFEETDGRVTRVNLAMPFQAAAYQFTLLKEEYGRPTQCNEYKGRTSIGLPVTQHVCIWRLSGGVIGWEDMMEGDITKMGIWAAIYTK